MLDKRCKEEQTLPLPLEEFLATGGGDLVADKLELKVGRLRLKPEVVCLFMALLGDAMGRSVVRESWDRFSDSLTLRYYLDPYMGRLPGCTTVMQGAKKRIASLLIANYL